MHQVGGKKNLEIASAVNDASNEEIKSGKTLRNPKRESIYIEREIDR